VLQRISAIIGYLYR